MTDPTEGPEPSAPVFRDRRRIDPTTYQVREPAGYQPAPDPGEPGGAAPPGGADDTGGDRVDADLAELTSDLQRLSAEYANYRKRVERDRQAVREQAVASTLVELLPILDDVGRARQHGELEGAFKSVGEALEGLVQRLGLEAYAEPGEPFDPTIHEALSAVPAPDPGEPVIIEVFQPGYRFADRVVRAARVVVSQPAPPSQPEGVETA